MRYTQPQSGAISIDWSNPLTDGLKCAVIAGVPYNVVQGNDLTPVYASEYVLTTTETGIAVDGSTASPGLTFPWNYTDRSTTELTTVFAGRWRSGLYVTTRAQLLAEAVGYGSGIHKPWYTYEIILFRINESNFNGYEIEATAPAGEFVAASSIRPSDFHTAYINGQQVGKVATGAYTLTTGSPDYAFTYGQQSSDGELGLIYDRALSDYELEQITTNPWQVFKDSSIGVARIATITLPTLVRPLSDVSTGAWTSTAGTLSAAVNESIANDSTYITTDSVSTCVMTLDQAAYPGGANQVLTYRASSSNGATITVTLKQGATTIASWTHSLTGTITEYAQTLSTPQIATIVVGPINVEITTS